MFSSVNVFEVLKLNVWKEDNVFFVNDFLVILKLLNLIGWFIGLKFLLLAFNVIGEILFKSNSSKDVINFIFLFKFIIFSLISINSFLSKKSLLLINITFAL